MSIRYFQIKDYTIVPVVDGFQFKFAKAGRNYASGGFNGLLEINDGPEADALAEVAAQYGAWEIDESAAIVVAQKKSSAMMNIVNMSSQGYQQNASPAEDSSDPEPEVENAVDSVDELLSEPEPEVIVESAKPKPKPKATRKPRKTAKANK